MSEEQVALVLQQILDNIFFVKVVLIAILVLRFLNIRYSILRTIFHDWFKEREKFPLYTDMMKSDDLLPEEDDSIHRR